MVNAAAQSPVKRSRNRSHRAKGDPSPQSAMPNPGDHKTRAAALPGSSPHSPRACRGARRSPTRLAGAAASRTCPLPRAGWPPAWSARPSLSPWPAARERPWRRSATRPLVLRLAVPPCSHPRGHGSQADHGRDRRRLCALPRDRCAIALGRASLIGTCPPRCRAIARLPRAAQTTSKAGHPSGPGGLADAKPAPFGADAPIGPPTGRRRRCEGRAYSSCPPAGQRPLIGVFPPEGLRRPADARITRVERQGA